MLLADDSIFIACVMALAVFDITKVVENGRSVEPRVEYTSGTIRFVDYLPAKDDALLTRGAVSHPKPFQCSIKPRSHSAEALILATEGMHDDAANRRV